MGVFENELRELQEICPGLPKLLGNAIKEKVPRCSGKGHGKWAQPWIKSALSYKTSVGFSSFVFMLPNTVFSKVISACSIFLIVPEFCDVDPTSWLRNESHKDNEP